MSKIAFLFPGQGLKPSAWGKPSRRLPAARHLFDRPATFSATIWRNLCFTGPAEELDSTNRSQPALFVTSLAAIESLRDASPDVVARARPRPA